MALGVSPLIELSSKGKTQQNALLTRISGARWTDIWKGFECSFSLMCWVEGSRAGDNVSDVPQAAAGNGQDLETKDISKRIFKQGRSVECNLPRATYLSRIFLGGGHDEFREPLVKKGPKANCASFHWQTMYQLYRSIGKCSLLFILALKQIYPQSSQLVFFQK